jgi:hypothetical protein
VGRRTSRRHVRDDSRRQWVWSQALQGSADTVLKAARMHTSPIFDVGSVLPGERAMGSIISTARLVVPCTEVKIEALCCPSKRRSKTRFGVASYRPGSRIPHRSTGARPQMEKAYLKRRDVANHDTADPVCHPSIYGEPYYQATHVDLA